MGPRSINRSFSVIQPGTAKRETLLPSGAPKPDTSHVVWSHPHDAGLPPAPSLNYLSLDEAFSHALRAAQLRDAVVGGKYADLVARPRAAIGEGFDRLDLATTPPRHLGDDAKLLDISRASHHLSFALKALELAQPRFVSLPRAARPSGGPTAPGVQRLTPYPLKRTLSPPEIEDSPRNKPVVIYRRNETAKPSSLDLPELQERSPNVGKPIVHPIKPGLSPTSDHPPLPLALAPYRTAEQADAELELQQPQPSPDYAAYAAAAAKLASDVADAELEQQQPQPSPDYAAYAAAAAKLASDVADTEPELQKPQPSPDYAAYAAAAAKLASDVADTELELQQPQPNPDYAAYAAAAAKLASDVDDLAPYVQALNDNGIGPESTPPAQAPAQPTVDPVYAAYLEQLEHMAVKIDGSTGQ